MDLLQNPNQQTFYITDESKAYLTLSFIKVYAKWRDHPSSLLSTNVGADKINSEQFNLWLNSTSLQPEI